MGQAKQRKAEIAKLKANGKITPFIIRGSIVNGKVVYDTTSLQPAQAAFVDGCVKSINEMEVPEPPAQDTHLTVVSWINSEDFIGSLMGPFTEGNTPDSVWDDMEMQYNKHQAQFPQVGFSYTRDEMIKLGAGVDIFFDALKEGGIWPWPNARSVFEKRGDKLVVIDTI